MYRGLSGNIWEVDRARRTFKAIGCEDERNERGEVKSRWGEEVDRDLEKEVKSI